MQHPSTTPAPSAWHPARLVALAGCLSPAVLLGTKTIIAQVAVRNRLITIDRFPSGLRNIESCLQHNKGSIADEVGRCERANTTKPAWAAAAPDAAPPLHGTHPAQPIALAILSIANLGRDHSSSTPRVTLKVKSLIKPDQFPYHPE
jgi:hypothetical protein